MRKFKPYLIPCVWVLLGLWLPGLLAPAFSSHGWFLVSAIVYAWTLVQPNVLVILGSLGALMMGDSLAGLPLGTTGIGALLLACSAFFLRKYWLRHAQSYLCGGYVGHMLLMVPFYALILPAWSWTQGWATSFLSSLIFPGMLRIARRYVAFWASGHNP